jgi:hypothetical protein
MNIHKIGATFEYLFTLNDVDVSTFVDFVPSCQIRSPVGVLWNNVECTPQEATAANQIVVKLYTNDFSNWRPGAMQLDVLFTRASDGFTRPTDTLHFQVVDQVTRP